MKSRKKTEALDRLTGLASELKAAYSGIADGVTATLAMVEAPIADIGETWTPPHSVGQPGLGETGEGQCPSGWFARETFVNGCEADYVLCVGRGQDRTCGLYVSIFRHRPAQHKRGTDDECDGPSEPQTRSTTIVPPDSLPVPLRVKMLNALDDFAAAYEQHVREKANGLLMQWQEKCAPRPEPAPEPRAKAKTKPKTQARSKSKPKPPPPETETANPDDELLILPDEPEEACVVGAGLDTDLPLDAWVPKRVGVSGRL